MKKAIALFGAIASLFFAGEGARSQVTFQGSNNYWANFRCAQNHPQGQCVAYVISASPGQSFQVLIDGWVFTRNVVSDSCGLVIFRPSPGQEIKGFLLDNFTFPGLPGWRYTNQFQTQTIPSCTNGQLSESRTVPFKTASGDFVLPASANTAYRLNYSADRSARLTANRCGLAILKSPPGRDLAVFLGGSRAGQMLYHEDLPQAPMIPRCNTVDGRAVPFVPVEWQR